jgi:hypothetical protein
MSHSSSAIEGWLLSIEPGEGQSRDRDVIPPADERPEGITPNQPGCDPRGITEQESLDNLADAGRDRLEVADAPSGGDETAANEDRDDG